MMTSTFTATSGILDNQALKFLAGCNGPCITLVVPAHHPGAQDGSRKALVHRMLHTAGEQLMRGKLASRAAELLAPLEEIEQEAGIAAGGAGFAIFCSPEYTTRYDLPCKRGDELAEKMVIAGHFYLAPFVGGACAPNEFFVLGLSIKRLRLFHYFNGECRELPLPAAVPGSLDAAGGFDQPDHRLENRSASGPSTGAMRGIRVGTLSDREAFPEYLHHFFGVVDRGLKSTLDGKPLLLMGVREEVAAYRRAAKHAHILTPDCLGSTDTLTVQDVAARAAHAGREHYQLLAERVFAEYLEMSDRARTLAHIPAVLRAASEGRVHRLCVRAGAELAGSGGEDLVNASIVETLRAGGDVFVLAPERMPAAYPLAAILRY
jgi:hypothetical protein